MDMNNKAPPSSTRSVPVDKHVAIGFLISKLISYLAKLVAFA